MIAAIIPARGGSKRIPGKNIRHFCGRPIIEYSIEAAIESNVFDRVIVSTDCDNIAAVAKQRGAEVPFSRPPELADDFASTAVVIQHAIDTIESAAEPLDYVCCIYGTAPFVSAADIRSGLEEIQRHPEADFALSVTTYPYPIFRSLRMNAEHECELFYPEHQTTRSQDLPQAWHDAGQFYWAEKPAWKLSSGGILSSRLRGIPIPRHRVQDIDTPEDWIRAELMFSALKTNDD